MQRGRMATGRYGELVGSLGTLCEDVRDAKLRSDAGCLRHQAIIDQLDEFRRLVDELSTVSRPELAHGSAPHSSLTPVAPTTCRHRSLSFLRKTAVSAGEVPRGVTENSRNLCTTSGRRRISAIAWERLAAISGGVFGGATTANQLSK